MKCQECGIDFEARKDAKYCSKICKKQAFQKRSVGTDNGTGEERIIVAQYVEPAVFKFTIVIGPKDKERDLVTQKSKVREAKYWYDVPLAAVPLLQEGWPEMPDFMNGRQYFLWWKNEFETKDGVPVIHNPFPTYDKLAYYQAGEGSRRWGAA